MAHLDRRKFLYLTLASGTTVFVGCGSDGVGQAFMGTGTSGGPDDDGDDDESTVDDDEGQNSSSGDPDDDDGTSGTTGSGVSSDSASEDESGDESSTGETDWMCENPFEGGTLLGTASFVGEGNSYIGNKSGNGRDARLAFDLGTLTEESPLVPNDDFFIRTEYPNQIDSSTPWSITIDGQVGQTTSLSIEDLAAMEQKTEVVVLECSGNGDFSHYGLMSAAEFSGVPLSAVLEQLDIDPGATGILVNGFDATSYTSTHSTPGASWVFTFEDLERAGAFLATHMNGEPLPPDHGQPVRLIIPGWYGCCNIKWVDRITFVSDDEPSTAQMREFASRTHQSGTPTLARDFRPALMQQAAMPVRVEKWDVAGETVYRIVGILWGGEETTDALQIRFDLGTPEAVEVCPPHLQNRTWTLWSHAWRPAGAGNYRIDMEIADPSVSTNRLDSGFYVREVYVD